MVPPPEAARLAVVLLAVAFKGPEPGSAFSGSNFLPMQAAPVARWSGQAPFMSPREPGPAGLAVRG